jgi:hypothetical protein
MSKLGIPEKPGKATGNRWSNKTLLNPLDKGEEIGRNIT